MNPVADTAATDHARGLRVTWIGVAWNLVLAGGKIAGGLAAGSRGLVADGVHSLSDLVSDGLVLVGMVVAARPSDRTHPYGHGKFESLGALGVAVILVVVAAGILVEGVRSLAGEPTAAPSTWAILVALASLAVKEYLYRITAAAAEAARSEALMANAWHHRTDALSSVVVLAGLVGTRLGFPLLDPVAACLVALAIAKAAWDIGRSALDKLTDKALTPEELAPILARGREVEGVVNLHETRARWMGTTILLDLHVLVHPAITVSEGHRIGEQVRQTLVREFPAVGGVEPHIEPEDHDEEFDPGPDRVQVSLQLEKAMAAVPELTEWNIFQLHYLEGRARVDLNILPPAGWDRERAKDAVERIRAAVAPLEGIALGRIYFAQGER